MGNKKKLLFVCRANFQRSPTAESLFKNSEKYEAKSAGTSQISETILSKQALDWADKIFVMEQKHKKFILRNFPNISKEVIVLDIPDSYYKNSPELIKLLKEKLHKYLPDIDI